MKKKELSKMKKLRKKASGTVGKDVDDVRFRDVVSQPQFMEIPKKKKFVKVDNRFKRKLVDKQFNVKTEIDMRGRRVNLLPKNTSDYLYEENSTGTSGESSEDSTDEDSKEIRLDLARGEGNVSSSDDESGSEWELEEISDSEQQQWGEFDMDAERVEWASYRLAVCNMDWDHITALDILMLLSSFKPAASAEIKSVTVYLSDFGKKRLKEEELNGPSIQNSAVSDDGSVDRIFGEAVRAYQLERLKYYYAIVECDSMNTACAIYEECDGMEYENSSVRLDLRFVPDGMTFDECNLKERVTSDDLNADKYKPRNFESAALANSNVDLTWDETDPERQKACRESFNVNADMEDFESLIGPASSDEEEDNQARNKLKLLMGVADNEKEEDLKISWDSEVKEEECEEDREIGAMENVAERACKDKADDEMTAWQNYQERRKRRKKERKALAAERKRTKQQQNEVSKSGEDDKHRASIGGGSGATGKSSATAQTASDIINDERFSALYTDSAFAISQSSPHYKPTVLMNRQVTEKRKWKTECEGTENLGSLTEKLKRKARSRLDKVEQVGFSRREAFRNNK